MKTQIAGPLAAGLLATPIAAVADPIDMEFGTTTGIYARDCSVSPGCNEPRPRLHEPLKVIHTQEHSRGNAIAPTGDNFLFVLHPLNQGQRLILGLTDGDELVDLWHGYLALA